MDFMKLLKSLEELLYELVSWLIFYPITMWRSISRPLEMMRYADMELSDRLEDQYDDTLSPPLFLLITLLIAQGISTMFPSIYDPSKTPVALTSTPNLLIGRGVVFSVFPLMMAVSLLRHRAIKLTRNSLRPPFFSQCYVAAPFALMVGLAFDLMLIPGRGEVLAGLAVLVFAIVWYAAIEVRWFRIDLQVTAARAMLLFAKAFLAALLVVLLVAIAVGWELAHWSV